MTRSIEFFGQQFERQIASGDFALNPFETAALPYMRGEVLDLGCGLGNLSIAAARRGAVVTALDACENAVSSLAERARRQGLAVTARPGDLRDWKADASYDAVACIGLLMFLDRSHALAVLSRIHDAVKRGGVAVINVLLEGTTYLAMFDAGAGYHLFTTEELLAPFEKWHRLDLEFPEYQAPGDTVKRFATLTVRRSER